MSNNCCVDNYIVIRIFIKLKINLLLLHNCLSDSSNLHILFESIFLGFPKAFFLVGIQLW